jgi:hypothetical protein
MSTIDDGTRPTSEGLAGRLRALRDATKPRVSQTAAAKAIGASQRKISRSETGRWVLAPDQVRRLCRLYGASRQDAQQLVEWAAALQPETVRRGTLLRRHVGAAFQKRIGDMEASAGVVRAFQPAMVLGVLQTEAYAREVFGPGDPEGVIERVRRTQRLLQEDTRRWLLVQPVGAYLWNLGGPEVMAEQMDAIIAASRLPHVDLRVVTPQQQVDLFATHGFHIYDEQGVVVGILTGTTLSTTTEDIHLYIEQHARLMAVGVADDEARGALAQVASQYREM